jgi:hypothetical protein
MSAERLMFEKLRVTPPRARGWNVTRRYGRWTRERAGSGPSDTYTDPDGRRYECRTPEGGSWSVVSMVAGVRTGLAGFSSLRDARRWIIDNVVSQHL